MARRHATTVQSVSQYNAETEAEFNRQLALLDAQRKQAIATFNAEVMTRVCTGSDPVLTVAWHEMQDAMNAYRINRFGH